MINDMVYKVLEGAMDIHLHAAPCVPERRQDVLEIARDAQRFKMKGFVVKDHHFCSAPIATMANQLTDNVRVIGGVVLNHSVGGLNPHAVESSFKMGGRVVWMPSLDSAWTLRQLSVSGFDATHIYQNLGASSNAKGISILENMDDPDSLKPEVREIVALAKEYDGVIETAHLSLKESFALLKEARRQGFRKVVVTHANQSIIRASVEEQRELAEQGAAIMYTMVQYLPNPGRKGYDSAELKEMIDAVGPQNVVLGTDLGGVLYPPPLEGFRMMVATLVRLGYDESTIRLMVCENAVRLYW